MIPDWYLYKKYIMGNKKGCLSARNINYWLNKGYSEEESRKFAKSRMPGTVEYFNIFKGYTIDESALASKEYRARQAKTLQNYINNHGVEIGTQKFDSYRNKQAISNSYEYKQKKHGWTEEEFDKFNKSRAITLENQIKKYGVEIGTQKFNEYCIKQQYAGCKLEYFIEKYGLIDGTEKYHFINFQKSNTLEAYMSKYRDPEIAIKKHNQYLKNRTKPHSAPATELFDILFNQLSDKYSRIFYYNNMQEWYIKDMNKRRTYFVDFFIKDIGKVIEFNGDYWHANPNKYQPEMEISYPNNIKRLVKDVWADDEYKLNLIKTHPDIKDVLVIWESDFKKFKNETINKCLEFINQ